MIEVQGLTRRFGPFTAIDGLEFTVAPGDVLGFIGPNGAGKTTTMRILTGYLAPSEGRVRVAGHDVFEEPMEVKQRVGYLPETPPLYPELSVGQYLRFVAELRGVSGRERALKVGEVMERVGLKGWEKRILGRLSKGYRQRVGLAQALVHDPEVLILDEPMSGLDPLQNESLRELIRELSGERTVVLSTHILREVEVLCDKVVVIHQGRILAQGSKAEICHAAAPPWTRVLIPEAPEREVARGLGELPGVERVQPLGEGAFSLQSEGDPAGEVAALSAERGWTLTRLERVKPGLEEAFLSLIRGAA